MTDDVDDRVVFESQTPLAGKNGASDITTRLIIPLLLLIAALYAHGVPGYIRALGIAAAVIICLINAIPWLIRTCAQARSASKDCRAARKNWSTLQVHIEGFWPFIASSRSDTIEYVMHNSPYLPEHASLQGVFVPITPDVFRSTLMQIQAWHRNTHSPTPENLRDAVNCVSSVIAAFNQHCVMPIFHLRAAEMRTALTPAAKSELESIRERFVHFLRDFQLYRESINRTMSQPILGRDHFGTPKPL